MTKQNRPHYAGNPLILSEIPGEGITSARGTSVPADGVTGYAKGCLFVDTDASSGAILYVNEGTISSADFNLVLADETVAYLDGVVAGTAYASKALVLDTSKRVGTVTEMAVTYPISGQGAPVAKTGVATISVADIFSGIVTLSHATGATVALTLDTGTAMDTGKPNTLGVDQAFDWSLINLSAAAADTGTLTEASGHTIVGNPIIQSAHSSTGGIYGNTARFRSRRTAANTWVTYRIA